ncbi:MAG: 2-dehydropantoate 2-reductase [Spirochaetales bacterium]|nr:2-dehydropantoate 2-reductase [Spirochaetales bacterium]
MEKKPIQIISIVGGGSLGQTYAAFLAQSGQPVTLLTTPGGAARLKEASAIRLTGGVSLQAPVAPVPAPAGQVGVTSDAKDLPAGTGLLFTTKGHQLHEAAAAVRKSWPKADDETAWVAGVQNGLAKDDILGRVFGAARVVGAATITAAQREADGTVVFTGRGMTYLGEFDERPSDRVKAAVGVLSRSGLPVEAVSDIRSVLWSKACNAAGVFGVSVLTRVPGGQLLGHPGRARAYVELVQETAAIGAAYGVLTGNYTAFPPIRTYVDRPVEETVEQFVARAAAAPKRPDARPSYPSMTQDLLAGRQLEVDEVFGDLVERAHRAGVPAPRLEIVTDLISGLNPQ